MNEHMLTAVIGAPASGKSTLADGIQARRPAVRLFGVRRHFNEQVKRATSVGLRAKPYVEAGRWIPDEIVAEAVAKEFEDNNLGEEVVFEGMPGNRNQAVLLDRVLEARHTPLQSVLWVDTPDHVCIARASRRIVCYACDGGAHQALSQAGNPSRCGRCGGPLSPRQGDDPSFLSKRLDLFHRQHDELFEYYGERVVRIDGLMSPDEVLKAAVATLES